MTMPRPAALVLVAALGALSAGPALAQRFTCTAPNVATTVEVDATAGRCVVDGRPASLQRAFDPVVCHVATPALVILTIRRDGAFVREDTGSGRVARGTCQAG